MKNLELLLHVEDGENPSGFGAVDSRVEVMGTEDREIWLERQQNHLVDINDHDASFFYGEFPPLPDFTCMSSSSSSSSTPVTVKVIACSSSASTASSSSSAAPWAVLRSDAEEDGEKRKNNNHHDQQQYRADPSTAALSSTALMEMSQLLDDSMDGVDCMENFGYLDLLDSNDLFDPSNIFHHEESPSEEFQQEHKPQQEQTRCPQEVLEHDGQMIMLQRKNNDETREDGASEDLAMVFLEWLKTNKETVSAEDLRRVKIKKATIECAAKCLGGGKEGMKQLLKLILEWVQANHLQKRRIKESPSIDNNSLPYQYQLDSFQNHNPNPTADPFPPPPDPNHCFSQPPWIAKPVYVPEPVSVVQGFVPTPVAGYMDPFSNAAHLPPHQPPTEYHILDSAQTWPPSQFALAPEYNTFPDNMLQPPPPPPQSVFIGYGNHYQYQYQHIRGHNDQRTLVRLRSSVTREARKKRMARQRRFSAPHRNHSHHHNQQSRHQNQSAVQHARLGSDNCTPTAQGNSPGSWVYWPPAADGVGYAPPALSADASVGPPLTSYHRQSASDRRQGWKSEKNLRFLLQKVLKQSDVGSLGRIVLPKKEAETHLPELEVRDGIPIAMEDIGTSRVWNMRYRFWPNNKSRMYLLENTGDFVRTNELQEGDFIVLYSDVRCGKYLIRGVKVRKPATGEAKPETNRPEKSQKNQHSNSPSSAAVNGSSTFSETIM